MRLNADDLAALNVLIESLDGDGYLHAVRKQPSNQRGEEGYVVEVS